MADPVIRFEDVHKRYRIYRQRYQSVKEILVHRRMGEWVDHWALRGVSLEVQPGTTLGLIGPNGAGKSTTLKVMARILTPDRGRTRIARRVSGLLELGAGFQLEYTGKENIYLNASLLGLSRKDIDRKYDAIVEFSELGSAIADPLRTYSSGMYMRLGFAVAAHLQADVLLLDEVFAVGDEEFQRKCFGKIFEFRERGGTIVFVSHDASAVERLCRRAILLRHGLVEHDGSTRDALAHYRELLADERDPAERAAGLREWGSGEVRIAEATLAGSHGEERRQFLGGEALVVRLRVVAEQPVPAPCLSYELRDDTGLLLAAGVQDTAELGWNGAPQDLRLRFDVDRLPLGDGRFHLRFGLADAGGGHVYHWLDDALQFVVYPGDADRGVVRLEGRWSLEHE